MKRFGCINALFILAATWHLRGEIGCLDNSWYLQKKYDAKEYHPVKCSCPCQKAYKIYRDRNRCSKCMHFRDARPLIIVSQATMGKISSELVKKALATPKNLP